MFKKLPSMSILFHGRLFQPNSLLRHKLFLLYLLVSCYFGSVFFSREVSTVSNVITPAKSIVIDPGHGGIDPGKVGVNDCLEKEINLSIAQKVKDLLEQDGYDVYLTRSNDKDLFPVTSKHPKRDDLQARVSLIEKVDPYFTVSIHQNSFPSENVSGPQVFYYHTSKEGAQLAQVLQTCLNDLLSPASKRECKDDDSYYLLKKTTTPTVIVECGFLSNPKEASMLVTDSYQDLVASAIYQGIVTYLNTTSSPNPVVLQ